jgi:arginine deiminase
VRFLIENEYDRLEAVLVHRPGMEIDRLTHENMRRYLFEDVPYLKRMQKEHDGFVEAMRGRGIEVVYLEQLLLDVLKDDESRGEVIEEVCRTAMAPAIADDLFGLKHWGVEELVDVLFAGLTGEEYTARTGGRAVMAKSLAAGSEEAYLLQPIPNAYFSRDPAVVVGEAVISCKMHYRERVRESVLVRAVLERHPEYYDNLITYGGTDEPSEDRPFTIEGGDVIILSPEAVMVGASERTRSETIEMLAGNCFRLGDVKRVYEIPIPSERAFMHLDTVFTVVDRGMILWYSEVMEKVAYIHRYEPDEEDGRLWRAGRPRSGGSWRCWRMSLGVR